MRFDRKLGEVEYKKIKKYFEDLGYTIEGTGSFRRRKEDIGDLDLVITRKGRKGETLLDLEEEILKLGRNYKEVKEKINRYEYLLESGISIHLIPEVMEKFIYTLWNSTGPKPHVAKIKEEYKEMGKKVNKELVKDEREIYLNLGRDYIEPKDRWKEL